jgi:galactosamine-6-phosphate isomerase
MDVEYLNNIELISNKASEIIIDELQRRHGMLLCTASGSSPLLTYQLLARKYKEDPGLFGNLRILKLDEWGGIRMDNPQSCEVYLQKNIVQPLHISTDRYIAFNTNPGQPEEECIRIASWLKQNGPIDICVLGLGLNGHIAFNEPADHLQPHCHIISLSEKSLQHSMATRMGEMPAFGITIGMADILQSRKIIMLVTGPGKKEIISKFLSGRITSELPASFLWLHPEVVCMVDNKAISD